MKRVFITNFDRDKFILKQCFPLARPFLETNKANFKIDLMNAERSNISSLGVEVTSTITNADFVLVAEYLTHQNDKNKYDELAKINQICAEKKIFGYAFITVDYGKIHPKFSNIIYYRQGGFKKQLDKNNRAFFPILNDHLKEIFNQNTISLRKKKETPTVGFCGHATSSIPKLLYEKMNFVKINLKRSLDGDFNFEPIFSPAFERFKILKIIQDSKEINTNFIFRGRYRAGAMTEEEIRKTTREYYNNIMESDYTVCLRGTGNFSVRLYETLMMGRIPVFINTDCLLPLEDEIDWKKHVVWVEWKDRKKIAKIILDFHKNISEENFTQIQMENRNIWMSKLNIRYFLEKIIKEN